MTEAYRLTAAPEPHHLRRVAILKAHPEIKALFGFDRRPVYRMAGALLVQLAIALAMERAFASLPAWAAWLVMIVTAYAVGAILNHYGGVVIHEASHNLCARTTTGNRWVAIFANLPKVLPYAMTFRRHHRTHHHHLGVEGIDNDLATRFERALIGRSPIMKLAWLFFYPLFGALCRNFLQRPDRWEVLHIAIQLSFNALVWITLGPYALAYLALSTWMSASLHPIAGHFIHEHYLWARDQETYSYYGPLNVVTENMGYHVEHHDFVGVPGSRLPELHRIARAHYAPLVSHTSWTGIFVRFVLDDRLSHASRFRRERRRGSGIEGPVTCPLEPRRLEPSAEPRRGLASASC
jgi:sphingolipid delta-4 desaturase